MITRLISMKKDMNKIIIIFLATLSMMTFVEVYSDDYLKIKVLLSLIHI